MEYMTPNVTKDMVKTHKILIPNMAVTQFRLMQAALASEGYQTEDVYKRQSLHGHRYADAQDAPDDGTPGAEVAFLQLHAVQPAL